MPDYISFEPEQIPYPFLQCDNAGYLRYANSFAQEILAILQLKIGEKVSDEIITTIEQSLDIDSLSELEMNIVDKVYLFQCVPIDSQKHVNIYVMDISPRKIFQNRLTLLENYDPVTELPNRKYFLHYLDKTIEDHLKMKTCGAVLQIKISNLRLIHETSGFQMVDNLLREVKNRLQSCLSNDALMARIADTEFAVCLSTIDNDVEVGELATQLLEILQSIFFLDGKKLNVSANIGVAVFPSDAQSSSQIMTNVSLALTRSLSLGNNTYYFYRRYLRSAATMHQVLSSELTQALEKNEFKMSLQPLYALKTKKIVGTEALLRWHHPEYGVVLPNAFTGIAEDMGLITGIGNWVIQEACRQLRALHDLGHEHLAMAINLSPIQFRQKDLPEIIERILKETNAPPASLIFEITEHVIIKNISYARGMLDKIRAHGIRIAIDDFGTGYSSLRYLSQLPVDKLKIDRSFIYDVLENKEHSAIVTSLIEMGHKLNLEVIAEGIENKKQEAFLQAHGCDLAQGFYYSKSLSFDDFVKFIKENPEKS